MPGETSSIKSDEAVDESHASLPESAIDSILTKKEDYGAAPSPPNKGESEKPKDTSKTSDGSSWSSEKEPEGKGFEIKVENPDNIFLAIEKGKSGIMGEVFLTDPLNKVVVELHTGKDSFNLVADIYYNAFSGTGPENYPKLHEGLFKALAQTGKGAKERGGRYIFESPEGVPFFVGRGSMFDVIQLSTGVYLDYTDKENQPFSAPAKEREVFDKITQAFAQKLQEAVEIIYKSFNQSVPEETLVIHPPAQKMNGDSSKERRTRVTSEVLRGKIEIEKPEISFADIGGQKEAKQEIEGLAFALKNPELYQKWGTRLPKGIILHGPPGTGKTLMAKALASQADARFFHVEASDVASKWYGESEQIVKAIFDMAKESDEKVIIFFDEIDAIAPKREGAHEATQKVISTLLENMDGMESQANVIVVASTNRLDSVDPSLIRSGRFDRWVEVPPPDEEGRREIFNIHIKKAEEIAGRQLFSEIQMDAIIAITDKVVGADVAEIVRRTLEEKVRQEGRGQQPGAVTTEDIIETIKNYEKTKTTRRQLGFLKNE